MTCVEGWTRAAGRLAQTARRMSEVIFRGPNGRGITKAVRLASPQTGVRQLPGHAARLSAQSGRISSGHFLVERAACACVRTWARVQKG